MKNLMAAITVIALLSLLGWGLYAGLALLLEHYRLLDSQRASLFILIAALALLCSFSIAFILRDAIRHLASQLQPEKAAAYREFAELWFQQGAGAGLQIGSDLPRDLNAAMSLWASEAVLKTYQSLARELENDAASEASLLKSGEKVLLEMRKDIGVSNSGVKLTLLLKTRPD